MPLGQPSSSNVKNSPVPQDLQARPCLGREQPLPSSSSEPPGWWARAGQRISSCGEQQELQQSWGKQPGVAVAAPGGSLCLGTGTDRQPQALGVTQGSLLSPALNNECFLLCFSIGERQCWEQEGLFGNLNQFKPSLG